MSPIAAKNPRRIARPDVRQLDGRTEFPDRVPDHMAAGTPEPLKSDLIRLLGEDKVLHRAIDLVRYATDASPYRILPQVVVTPETTDDLVKLINYTRGTGRHLTFRGGGSSLNGQVQTDEILVDMRHHFRGMVLEGTVLRVRPGEVLRNVQAVLARSGRRFAPDPASESVATIGGILSNNSGGMRCPPEQDSYHSLESVRLVLASGTVVDTGAPDADAKLAAAEPEIHAGLAALRDEIRADEKLVARLRRKFTIRNTNGLRLDAFLDEDQPVKILGRLMVGSEGILGCIDEARLRTLELPTKRAVTWVMLPRLDLAAGYVADIVAAGAAACELLVSPVLRESVGNFAGAEESWADLSDDDSALLVEVAGRDERELEEKIAAVREVLAEAELTSPLEFMYDKVSMDQAWEIRGGLMPLFSTTRPDGSALLTEDACCPPAEVGAASKDLMDLLTSFGYPPMVMGHAAYGNLHFFLTPNFEDENARDEYARFMQAFAELILDKYDGSMKAEHGTGRNMAPFVRREWGDHIYELFWRVKKLLDPQGVLNPGTKLSLDDEIAMRDFKSYPRIEEVANACIECGFCESVCPSRHVTVTPRQRIALRREMARQPEGSPVLDALHADYGYDAVDMCAADGTCAIACPISIDTGAMMKQFRALEATETADRIALALAKRWETVEAAARTGLGTADIVTRVLGKPAGTALVSGITSLARKVVATDLMPSAENGLPPAANATLPETTAQGAAAVYFPACINRMFGRSIGEKSLAQTLVDLSARAGRPVVIPDDVAGSCCATPFSSKGYKPAKKYMSEQLARDLIRWSDHGRLPVVVDAASCTHNILDEIPGQLDGELAEQFGKVRVLDAVEWAHDELVPALEVTHRAGRVAVHPNCSLQHMGLADELVDVARFAATDAFVPHGAACCGAAGDRGLLHPELLEAATRDERAGLKTAEADMAVDAYVSANRTCEVGMEQVTGRDFEHVLYLLDEATRPD
ncbi:FAD-binding and (Fe-S)-binding domain-containing protein [Corynebacterium frankenforstense]|uniref:FAD-binding and (Fe-S)-binding domain-containing protein n=1 Tax=Corynebacterium TaxID=1716 RepID=UPI00254FB360|nr:MULTISPECIES: FAD-binding and (Fe-S)-binding domain-containing protein [Corynebacterium]MDK6259491.1 FAD-binding and (Fe-S)-binding domain-containing protein [Corynebacterium frankenforstense]MDK8895083.1 FAD-binding and (Fe-S)-binding domain-containing protein [Corynebacterium sp. MSK006]